MNRTQRRDFFEAALQNPTNIFMTIHGGPLSYSAKTANENPVGIVPEGCILVIITPPQAVVFSSPTEDTETSTLGTSTKNSHISRGSIYPASLKYSPSYRIEIPEISEAFFALTY